MIVLALSIYLLLDPSVVLMVNKGAQTVTTVTYILMAVGAGMTVFGFLGSFGALRESQCLLGSVIYIRIHKLILGCNYYL